MMKYNFLPATISQHLLVEVYLPKNLLNYGALIGFLTEIIEFRRAHNWLIKNCEEMWNNDDIWKKHYPKCKDFKQRVMDMKETIFGFSIYEVDGAFKYEAGDKKGKPIPVKVFTLIQEQREEFIRALKEERIDDNIRLGFKRNYQALGNSGNLKIEKNPDGKRWEIQDGNDLYEIVDTDTQLDVSRSIHLLEERVLVVRFITDLKIGTDRFILMDRDSGDGEMDEARKRIWDTMTLIGGYFVRHLGTRVRIEDVIWTTYNVGFLWIWEKGEPQAAN